METTYNPKYIEARWITEWEKAGYFKPQGKGNPYCIVIPPPNVTGTLHMGHGFQDTIMDILIRYHRMLGDNTLWQIGTDHAGISTQMVVTQRLLAQGQDPYQLGREKFMQKIWDWKEYANEAITKQLRRIGISADWERERFTLDEGLSKAVQKVFIELYEEGLIYRGKRLVNWDPILHTAISDLEVISEEQDGHLWYIRYPIVNSEDFVIIATTRPETMLGDTAIAVNPDDERYQHLIGKEAILPLTERTIPIIADHYVDPEFGTGCVKITPAHDFNDYAIGQRHDLPIINILTSDAKLNDNTPDHYRGMDRFLAREKIIADLKKAHLLEKIVAHKLKVPRGDRSNAIIEPYLTDQWFVNVAPLAKPAIAAVTSGKIKFVPENWSKIYLQWLNNIEDWCISRQLWWGHRIPAWYDEENHIYVGHDEAEIRKKYNLGNKIKLTQDEDVLDTWFSSALWPFSSLGWPDEKIAAFYPTSVLVTGFDIIFFWVVRMVMMGLKFTGEVPFHEVYITGLIRDKDGQKMSKSKGNVLDPIDLVDGITLNDLIKKRTADLMQPALAEKIATETKEEFPEGIKAHGMDALRFTFCALASTGRDINFDINRLAGYRNFCNKIWNAARLVLMRHNNINNSVPLTLADRWILSRTQLVIKEVHQAIADYRFDLLAQTLYEFIWHEYCDWYLELCKVADELNNTIIEIFTTILRLIHPIMPFISEEIWQQFQQNSIMMQRYPKDNKKLIDNGSLEEMSWLQKIIISIRNIRGEINISPNKPIALILAKGSTEDKKHVNAQQQYLTKIAKLTSIKWQQKDETLPLTATAIVGTLELHIPFADLIDIPAEIERLEKAISKLKKEIEKSTLKLNNINYVKNAPKDIVAKERMKVDENKKTMLKLEQSLQKIAQ